MLRGWKKCYQSSFLKLQDCHDQIFTTPAYLNIFFKTKYCRPGQDLQLQCADVGSKLSHNF